MIMLSLTRHASVDWLTLCDVMPARRMRSATRSVVSILSPASAARESARSIHHSDVMSREQHCLVYSIDAILGLTSAGQRSSSATFGRRKYHELNDASELQPNATTSQKASSGRPIIGLLAPNSRSVGLQFIVGSSS